MTFLRNFAIICIMNIVSIGGAGKESALEFAKERMETQDVLVIPSACSNPTAFFEDSKVQKAMRSFEELGFKPELLHEHGQTPTPTMIEDMFGKSELLYVIGGHTPTLLGNLAFHGTDAAILEAVENDKWLTGTSAGGLLPFEQAFICSAKRPAEEAEWDYEYVNALSIIKTAATMHANQKDPTPFGDRSGTRHDYFVETRMNNAQRGIAVPNGAALAVHGNQASAIYKTPETPRINLVQAGLQAEEPIQVVEAEDTLHLTEFLALAN